MSDGPHRTLNMRPHWKLVAQRTANLAHSADEVSLTFASAVTKDILGAPIAAVREIMSNVALFPEIRVQQLEALRTKAQRSAETNALVDCASVAAGAGFTGDAATATAISAAMGDIARAQSRGIDEHYQREGGARASRTVRERLRDALGKVDYAGIANGLLSSTGLPSKRAVELPRQTGTEEGPRL